MYYNGLVFLFLFVLFFVVILKSSASFNFLEQMM